MGMNKVGLKALDVVDDYVVGKTLAKDLVDAETGEVIASANEEITADLLARLRAAGIKSFETLYTTWIAAPTSPRPWGRIPPRRRWKRRWRSIA